MLPKLGFLVEGVQRKVLPTFVYTEAFLREPEICNCRKLLLLPNDVMQEAGVGVVVIPLALLLQVQPKDPEELEMWRLSWFPAPWTGWQPSACSFWVLFVTTSCVYETI